MDNMKTQQDTSPSLLLRIRDPGDGDSWRTFERVYGQIIRSYCQHWRLQSVDADDVTQEVLKAINNRIPTFEYDPAKGRFRAWLGTVTSNTIKRFISRNTKRDKSGVRFEVSVSEFDEVCADPDTHWVDIYSERILQEACRIVRLEFEDKTWLCFEGTWIDQRSPQDVAESLDVGVHAVYVNKSRVIKRLEQEIRNLAEDVVIQDDP